MTPFLKRAVPIFVTCLVGCWLSASAQTVDSNPSKKTLDDAAGDNCENVSVVVQRCGQKPVAAPAKPSDDALARSRAQTKAAFDRRDQNARDQALKGQPPAVNTPVGDAQRLGGVTVTGNAVDDAPQPEAVIQKALVPPTASPNGTVSKYMPNGTRYDCIEKCVGPACCVEVRTLPNPARDVNSLNGH
jgi:hypothetical protein